VSVHFFHCVKFFPLFPFFLKGDLSYHPPFQSCIMNIFCFFSVGPPHPPPLLVSSSSLTTEAVALTCFDACSNGMKTGNGNDSLAGPFCLEPCVPSRACPSLSLFRLRSRSALACLAPKYLGALKPPAFWVAASVSGSINLQQS